MRIDAFLAEQQVAFEALAHPPAYTAQKRAKYLHVSGSQVAKCVLLRDATGFWLAVLPATHQVDTARLALELGGPIRLATDSEMAAIFQDCEWGAAPPFGTLYGVRTLLDDSLSPDALLVVEGHTHFEAIRLLCRDFERLEKPRRLRFAYRPAPAAGA